MARTAHRYNRRRNLVNYPAAPLPRLVALFDPVFDLVFGSVDIQVEQEIELLGSVTYDFVDALGAVTGTVTFPATGGPSPSITGVIAGAPVSGNFLVIPPFKDGLRGVSGEWPGAARWTVP